MELAANVGDLSVARHDGGGVGMTLGGTGSGVLDLPVRRGVDQRLRPLYVAAFLQYVGLWVPVEKLFMTAIGFDTAAIGVMAALYALVVPLLEVPSGVMADRWSRRGVLIIATLALTVSVTIGGLSPNVGWYIVSAMFLGVFFAMQSGTYESMVYDTVIEETGTSDLFERTIGRTRLVQSISLVASAIVGSALAEVLPLRATYFLTIPFVAASGIVVLLFREPRLHRSETPQPLRSQLAATYRTLLQKGRLRAIIVLTVLTAVLMQMIFEFGPVWLVALAVPAIIYGPHWAGLTLALGIGGLLGARRGITRLPSLVLIGALLVGSFVVLSVSRNAIAVIGAQIVLILLLVAVSVPLTRRLHDAVPSTLRAGVASGTGTLSWLTFLPCALAFGFIGDRSDVHAAGWLLVAIGAVTALLLVFSLRGALAEPVAAPPVYEAGEPMPMPGPAGAQPTFPPDRFLPPDDPEWAGHWSRPPNDWERILGVRVDEQHALGHVRTAILELPPVQQRVIVLRDVEGQSSAEASRVLGLDEDTARTLLHRARSSVRARLESLYEAMDT